MHHLPNAITIARMGLVPIILWLIFQRQFDQALMVAFIAGVSDALDGLLAKRFDWSSETGQVLDPLADKLLLVVTFCGLASVQLLPWWLVAAVLLRDVVIVAGAFSYHYLVTTFVGRPTLLSKLNTLLQIVLALWVLSSAAGVFDGAWLVPWLVGLVAVTTVTSGIHYIWLYWNKARRHSRVSPHQEKS